MAAKGVSLVVVAQVLLPCLVGSRAFAADSCLFTGSAVMSFFEAPMCLSAAALAGVRAVV